MFVLFSFYSFIILFSFVFFLTLRCMMSLWDLQNRRLKSFNQTSSVVKITLWSVKCEKLHLPSKRIVPGSGRTYALRSFGHSQTAQTPKWLVFTTGMIIRSWFKFTLACWLYLFSAHLHQTEERHLESIEYTVLHTLRRCKGKIKSIHHLKMFWKKRLIFCFLSIKKNNEYIYCAYICQVWRSWRMSIITPSLGQLYHS